MNLRTWTVAALSFAVFMGACRKNEASSSAAGEKASQEHKDEPEHEGIPKKVKLSDKVVTDAKIETALVTKEVLSRTLALPGEVSVDPDKSARVSSPVPGRISQVFFKEGSRVEKGAALASIRIPDLAKVRSAHAGASARAASARTNANRLEELSKKGLAANQEYLNAKAEADALEAETKALGEQLRTLGLSTIGGGSELIVRAPIGGIVVSRAAVMGQPVGSDEVIASIVDLSEVWFLARIFEKDLESIKVGAKSEVQLNAFPKQRYVGAVEYVGRQIDPVARTLTARIRLAATDDSLRIGLFGIAHVAVATEQSEPVLVVPRTAVSDVSGKPVIFVRQPDGDFELHDVVLGQSNLGKVQVLSGLREGERVVTSGAFTVKSAILRGSMAEDD